MIESHMHRLGRCVFGLVNFDYKLGSNWVMYLKKSLYFLLSLVFSLSAYGSSMLEIEAAKTIGASDFVGIVEITKVDARFSDGVECGVAYTAKVLNQFSNPDEDVAEIKFGREIGMEFGERYLVSLVRFDSYEQYYDYLKLTIRVPPKHLVGSSQQLMCGDIIPGYLINPLGSWLLRDWKK